MRMGKRGTLEVWGADPDLGLELMVMRLPSGRKSTPIAIQLDEDERVWLIEQLQRKGR